MKSFSTYPPFLWGICFLILCCQCQNSKDTQKTDTQLIKLELKDKPIQLEPDSLFCGKEIIPLETNDECLISQIEKLEIVNDTLYIFDDEQDMLFIFDKTGKYITKIDDIGRGPQEYLHISDFHIDDQLIYLTAGSNRKVMCYDLKGNFKKSFSTEYSASNITTDSNYIYVYYNFSNPNHYNVGIYDKKENKLIKRYKNYPPQQEGVSYGRGCWTSCNNKVYASFTYEYNIYELSPDTCRILYSIDYGEKYMFPKDWNTYSPQQMEDYREKTGGIFNSPIIPDCSSFSLHHKDYFTFIHHHISNLCIINHKNNTITYGVPQPSNSYYWNTYGLSPIYVSDEYMVRSASTSLIISYRERQGKIPELSQEWALDIKEEDNPCLCFYKLKN